MSVVTNIILTCGLSEEDGEDVFPAVNEINAWLRERGKGELTHLNGNEGGRKAWEVDVFGGAFNWLPIDEFIQAVSAANWQNRDKVQLFIKGQYDEVFGLLNLVAPYESRLASSETRNARKALGRTDEDEPWL